MWTTLPQSSAALVPVRATRDTQPDAPVAPGYLWYGPGRHAGVRVTADEILKLSAAWCCVRYIAESLAQVDWNVYRSLPAGGQEYVPDHQLDWLLDRRPNPEMSAFDFRRVMVAWAATRGNSYAEIEREPRRNRPANLWPIEPHRVRLLRADSGRLFYRVSNRTAPPDDVDFEDMFHLRGLSWDGLLGYAPAQVAGQMFGLGLAAQQFAASFFANDSTPGGILTTDQVLNQGTVTRLAARFQAAHRGPDKAFLLAVLEQNLRYQQVGADPEKAQALASRQETVLEVCRFFKVPPHKAMHVQQAAKANMEHQGREAVQDCLTPWGKALEGEADLKLLGPREERALFTRHDFSVLQRADLQTFTDHLIKLMDRGVYSVNDARDKLDENPISEAEGGRKRFFPMNFMLLEDAGDPAAMAAYKGAGAGPGASSGDAPGAGTNNAPTPGAPAAAGDAGLRPKALAAARGVLRDAFERMLARVAHAAKRAAKGADWDGWQARFWPAFAADFAAALTPACVLLATLGLDVAPDALAADQCAEQRAALDRAYNTDTPAAFAARLDGWSGRAADLSLRVVPEDRRDGH